MAEIWEANEAREIAAELIPEYHRHLYGHEVLFLFTDKTQKSRGKLIGAKVSKLNDTQRYLSSGTGASVEEGAEYMILISKEIWDSLLTSQRRALIDHELCHIVEKPPKEDAEEDEPTLTIIGHDIEEFDAIVQRHGLWHDAHKSFGRVVAEQLRLPALV